MRQFQLLTFIIVHSRTPSFCIKNGPIWFLLGLRNLDILIFNRKLQEGSDLTAPKLAAKREKFETLFCCTVYLRYIAELIKPQKGKKAKLAGLQKN